MSQGLIVSIWEQGQSWLTGEGTGKERKREKESKIGRRREKRGKGEMREELLLAPESQKG